MGFKQRIRVLPGQQTILHQSFMFRDPGEFYGAMISKHRKHAEALEVAETRDLTSCFSSPGPLQRRDSPGTPMSQRTDDTYTGRSDRFPILSPNRQQAEMYRVKMRQERRQNVIPMDGPGKSLAISGTYNPGEMAVFDDQAANAVLLEAESQLKSGYPTIATSTLVHSKRQRHPSFQEDFADTQNDMKFLSELVKPIQYRWKFQKDKLKTITPSKYGFHPRSKSPTFKRLIEATEKLQVMSEDGEEEELLRLRKYARDVVDAETQVDYEKGIDKILGMRNAVSEPSNSKRESIANSLPASFERSVTPLTAEVKPEVRTFEAFQLEKETTSRDDTESPTRQENTFVTDSVSEESFHNEVPRTKTVKEFKVDFKRMDSHSELHLFLPHIHEAMSRGATPEYKHTKPSTNTRSLPSITDTNDNKTEEKSRIRVRRKGDRKKRTRSQVRTKSVGDEKVFRDVLNDVPTLISMEKETIDPYHPASMCVFEHCPHHPHRKSTSLRQP